MTNYMRAAMLSAVMSGVGSAASAAVTVYTDRAAWEAAVSNINNNTFEENGPGEITFYGLEYQGQRWRLEAEDIFTRDNRYTPCFPGAECDGDYDFEWNTGDVLSTGESGIIEGDHIFEFYVDPDVTAFGFDFGAVDSFYSQGLGYFDIAGLRYEQLDQPNLQFWGIVSDQAIGPVVFTFNGASGSVDNVATADGIINAVPEPATWAMMIAGFGLVGASMRRRSATVVAP